MMRLVREYSTLSEAQALLVVQMAKTQAIALGGTENYLVTRQFKEMSNRAQRVDLLRCLFAVAAADQNISRRREHGDHRDRRGARLRRARRSRRCARRTAISSRC